MNILKYMPQFVGRGGILNCGRGDLEKYYLDFINDGNKWNLQARWCSLELITVTIEL